MSHTLPRSVVRGVSQSGVQARVRLVGPDANSTGVAKNVIEVQGPNGVQWLEGTRANAKQYSLNPTQFSQQAAQAAWIEKEDRERRATGVADGKRYKDGAETRANQQSAAQVDATRANSDVARAGIRQRDRQLGQADSQISNAHEINQGNLGVNRQNADTNRIQVTGNLSNEERRLRLSARELTQRGEQFDQTHLLSQQQAAMNYNLGVHTLNERMDNAEQDRRLRTMEGIGAAIAGLAAMIGG